MRLTTNSDALRLAADWLRSYESEDDDMPGFLAEIADFLDHKAKAAEVAAAVHAAEAEVTAAAARTGLSKAEIRRRLRARLTR